MSSPGPLSSAWRQCKPADRAVAVILTAGSGWIGAFVTLPRLSHLRMATEVTQSLKGLDQPLASVLGFGVPYFKTFFLMEPL